MNPIDQISIYLVMAISVGLMIASIEAGFWFGDVREGKPNKSQMAQVRAIMGASLGLLAFMLAFSFNTAQQHFETRIQGYMLEISAIDSAYRGADLLADTHQAQAQDLLRDFARLRIDTSAAANAGDMETVVEMIRESERLHDRLWSVAETAMQQAGERESNGIFAQSILTMIDAHDARLQAAFFNRVSPVIWITLAAMSVLSMLIMGYQAGLTGTRSRLATWTLAGTFSFVIMLITDLDRPRTTLFKMNQELLVEMNQRMHGEDPWRADSVELN